MWTWSLNREGFELQRVRRKLTRTELQHGHKPISMLRAVNIRAAEDAMDTYWSKWIMKQCYVCGMVINTTMLFVDRPPPQLKTPQIIRDSNNNHITHPPQMSESVFYPQNVEHQWKSRSYTSNKIGMKVRTSPELCLLHDILLDSESCSIIRSLQAPKKAKPRVRAQNTWKIAKLKPEIGSRRTWN